MKNTLITVIFFILTLPITAQNFQINDLSGSLGSWEGKLTYLDYTTGKPFTMLANIKINLTENKKGYIMQYEYPAEPHANSKDTTYINDNSFGKERIIEFTKITKRGFRLITEKEGTDGNDHKNAIIRHTYELKENSYSITKQVKFDSTKKWIIRNEYELKRISN